MRSRRPRPRARAPRPRTRPRPARGEGRPAPPIPRPGGGGAAWPEPRPPPWPGPGPRPTPARGGGGGPASARSWRGPEPAPAGSWRPRIPPGWSWSAASSQVTRAVGASSLVNKLPGGRYHLSVDDRPRRCIPEATVARLPVYLRSLLDQAESKTSTISSERLAELAGVNAAKVRKDLSYLGSYGTRGVGYDVEYLLYQISRELGLTQ